MQSEAIFNTPLSSKKANKYIKLATRLPERVLTFPGREKNLWDTREVGCWVTRDCKAYLECPVKTEAFIRASTRTSKNLTVNFKNVTQNNKLQCLLR